MSAPLEGENSSVSCALVWYGVLQQQGVLTRWCVVWRQYRSSGPGECREAENSIMCKDFLRMGRSSFVIDPGVRLAYSAHESRQLYTAKVGGAPRVVCTGVVRLLNCARTSPAQHSSSSSSISAL